MSRAHSVPCVCADPKKRKVVVTRGPTAEAKRLSNQARADEMGLLAGGPDVMPPQWSEPPSEQEAGTVADLDSGVQLRIATARMQSKDKRTGTALGVFEQVRAVAPHLVSFRPLRSAGDLTTSLHNEKALCRVAEHCRRRREVLASSVSGYVSALKLLVERAHGQPLLAPMASGSMLAELYLSMRKEDGPRAARRLGRAMRSFHIRKIVAHPSFVLIIVTYQGTMAHAIRHAAHQCFLRPGEVGTVDGQPFTAATQLVCGPDSVVWMTLIELNADRPKLFMWVLSIKDSEAKRKRTPITIEPRAPGDQSGPFDPLCPYQSIRAWWRMRTAAFPASQWNELPLFLAPGKHPSDASTASVFSSHHMLDLARKDAVLCGLDPAEIFGNTWRVGAATDLRDAPFTVGGPPIGMEQATRMIKSRGRWWTDIHEIYERLSLAEHALASAAITEAGGFDLEAVLRGWVQPGR